jgi:hypothetical protein
MARGLLLPREASSFRTIPTRIAIKASPGTMRCSGMIHTNGLAYRMSFSFISLPFYSSSVQGILKESEFLKWLHTSYS